MGCLGKKNRLLGLGFLKKRMEDKFSSLNMGSGSDDEDGSYDYCDDKISNREQVTFFAFPILPVLIIFLAWIVDHLKLIAQGK